VLDELTAVVGGDRLSPAGRDSSKAAYGGGVELHGLAAGQTRDDHISAPAFNAGGQAAVAGEHGVGFPVADLLSRINVLGSLLDANAIGNAAAAGPGSIGLSAEFVALTQPLPQRSAGLTIRADVLINTLMTDPHPPVAGKVSADASGDLLRRPL